MSFRQEYFSFRLYFCLIADNQGIIHFPFTFPPLFVLQNKISYQTINYVISVIPNMIRSAVSVHSPESYCSLRQFDGECTANPRRLQYDNTEIALRIEKFLNRLKNFCTLANPKILKTLKTEKCSIRCGVAVKFAKVLEQHNKTTIAVCFV